MKIGLVDVDSHNFPSLPLMKLSAYHKKQGDYVEWYSPFCNTHYDIVYKSKVFDFTADYTVDPSRADTIIEGGTGYKNNNAVLPKEVETICPDYSLYPQFSEAYGFLTRGCPRNCKFCVVTQKEGNQAVQVADVGDFHRGQRTIKLLDPNLLACQDREKLLIQLAKTSAYIDFTQGLDIRLVDKDIITLISRLKIKMIHFAWDNPKEDLTAMFCFFGKHFRIKDYTRKTVYVLTNFNSTHDEDLHRIYTLRDIGFNPFVMIYDKQNAPKQTTQLQRYVNGRQIFRSINTFEEYKAV